jgi:hypothetical protein
MAIHATACVRVTPSTRQIRSHGGFRTGCTGRFPTISKPATLLLLPFWKYDRRHTRHVSVDTRRELAQQRRDALKDRRSSRSRIGWNVASRLTRCTMTREINTAQHRTISMSDKVNERKFLIGIEVDADVLHRCSKRRYTKRGR